jgi:hypothetical protein
VRKPGCKRRFQPLGIGGVLLRFQPDTQQVVFGFNCDASGQGQGDSGAWIEAAAMAHPHAGAGTGPVKEPGGFGVGEIPEAVLYPELYEYDDGFIRSCNWRISFPRPNGRVFRIKRRQTCIMPVFGLKTSIFFTFL